MALETILSQSQQCHKKTKKSGNQGFKLWPYVQSSKVIRARMEKECLAIKLAEAGKTTRDIAQAAHFSLLKGIGTILRRYAGEDGESPCRDKGLSTCSRAFKLFKEGKLVDTAIALDMEAGEVLWVHGDCLRLLSLQKLM